MYSKAEFINQKVRMLKENKGKKKVVQENEVLTFPLIKASYFTLQM